MTQIYSFLVHDRNNLNFPQGCLKFKPYIQKITLFILRYAQLDQISSPLIKIETSALFQPRKWWW